MPNFVSVLGSWKPKKEKVYIPEKEEVYEGPDRAALEMIKDNGGAMGSDYKLNPDLVIKARQLGFTVEEYLKLYNNDFDDKKERDRLLKISGESHKHELPKRKNAAKIDQSGGMDTSGNGKHIYGGLGDAPVAR